MKKLLIKVLYTIWIRLANKNRLPKVCERINLWINKLEKQMSKNRIKGIYVEVETDENKVEQIHIKELDREDYEQFLEMMHGLRLAYITSMRKMDNGDERD